MPELVCLRTDGDMEISLFLRRLEEIKASGNDIFVVSVNSSCICSAEHLFSVFQKAMRSFKIGRSRSRTPEAEFFRILAMEDQLNVAIEKCGLSEEISEFCLIYAGIHSENISSLITDFSLVTVDISSCSPDRLSSLGFQSLEELLEATALFDAGIPD